MARERSYAGRFATAKTGPPTMNAAVAACLSAILAMSIWAQEVVVAAEAPRPKQPSEGEPTKDLSVGGLWYLSFQNTSDANAFEIKRGYINVKKKVLKWGENYLEGRITPDTHQDDSGDLKVRLKYAYGKFNWKSVGFQPWLEIGIVHMPWLDFEEHINLYRMQDTMFVERNKTFNSADAGLTFGGFLGPALEGRKYYPGRWGSFAVGIYNGGGYHAKEKNKNKVLEGRMTLRPLPDHLPGLQVSYFGLTGKGNQETAPDWNAHVGMLSYECDLAVLTATLYAGDGNQSGTAVNADGKSLSRKGYSVFTEVKPPFIEAVSLVLRYDYFDPDMLVGDDHNDRYIAGVAWDLGRHNTFLLDYDHVSRSGDNGDDDRIQMTLQIKF